MANGRWPERGGFTARDGSLGVGGIPGQGGGDFLSVLFCDQNRHFHPQMAGSPVQNLE